MRKTIGGRVRVLFVSENKPISTVFTISYIALLMMRASGVGVGGSRHQSSAQNSRTTKCSSCTPRARPREASRSLHFGGHGRDTAASICRSCLPRARLVSRSPLMVEGTQGQLGGGCRRSIPIPQVLRAGSMEDMLLASVSADLSGLTVRHGNWDARVLGDGVGRLDMHRG